MIGHMLARTKEMSEQTMFIAPAVNGGHMGR